MANSKTDNYTPMPDTAKIDPKVVKKMVGEALSGIDGILDAKDRLADLFKNEEDPTRGVQVTVTDDQEATVNAKIITETGKNIPDIVNAAAKAITDTLQGTAGLKVKDICVEVADTMTCEEYEKSKTPVYYETTAPRLL